jgi:hypothetical protein
VFITEQALEPAAIAEQQVRALVSGEPSRKTQREDIPVERRVRQCHRSLWMAAPPEVPLQSGADSEHKLVPGFAPHRPERFIRERRHVPV